MVDFLAGDDISDIDNALIAIVSIVIEEDVLGVVVSLVDQEKLGAVV